VRALKSANQKQTLRKYLFVTPNKRGRLVVEGGGSGEVMAWKSGSCMVK